MPRFALAASIALLALVPSAASRGADGVELRSLDGSGNNAIHLDWGKAGTPYLRVTPAAYPDGLGSMVGGPSVRYVSNRTFNDRAQNIFSENGISQWGWLWGQFMDHTFGLRDETPGENAAIAFDPADPLEDFTNDFGAIGFARTPAAPGTGVTTKRQQINTVSSWIDGWNVYGGTNARLEWLRRGSVDGNLANNRGSLLLPNNYLPRVDARGDASSAPAMDLMGRLVGTPTKAVVAGDVRANENIALTGVHTLFAREHNRIVAALPDTLTDEQKFQIARRVVGAEEQWITYTEFLPAMGVQLAPYHGYDASVNGTLSNEFATVGYRAHSQIHGEMEPKARAGRYTAAQLDAFRAQGIEVEDEGDEVVLVIPLNLAFGNPDLLQSVGVGPLLKGLAEEREYKNDEQIDNQLRSVLFQVPKPGVDPDECLDGPPLPDCFNGVVDLAAIDIARGRDHGMPSYNALRLAYGLPAKTSFREITGEATSSFPADPLIDPLQPLDDPNILDFVELRDGGGNLVMPGTDAAENGVVTARRRTTVAARLRALYGSIDKVDAFVGMSAEKHLPGSEFGELQHAMWKTQFEALRDGDRFFYANDPYLTFIRTTYGIDYRHTVADVIELNTGVEVQDNVFEAPVEEAPAGPVAAYSFDAGAGSTVADVSGHGNTGTLANTTWLAAGKFGSALSFDGASSSVTIPDAASLDLAAQMTLEAWVRPTALGTTWRTVLFKEQPGGMAYSLYANNGATRPVGQVSIGGEQNAAGSAPLALNVWTHLAATYDGATLTLYVNGAVAGSKPQTGSIDVSSGALRIGGNSVWPEWFRGAIDEVRVYDRALTQVEIQTDMVAPIAPDAAATLFGDRQIEPDANPQSAGIAEAFASISSASGNVRSVSVYLDPGSTAPTLVAGVYSDGGGHPADLLAEGTLDAPAAGAWNTIAVPPALVAAGATYWIALLGPNGGLVFRDRCCTVVGVGPTETNAQTGLAALPAQWTTGTVYDDAPMSAYASG
jgi:hypothetical protein